MGDPRMSDLRVHEISARDSAGVKLGALVRVSDMDSARARAMTLWPVDSGFRDQSTSELQTFRFLERAESAARALQPRGFLEAEAEWDSGVECYVVRLNGNEGRHTYLPRSWAPRPHARLQKRIAELEAKLTATESVAETNLREWKKAEAEVRELCVHGAEPTNEEWVALKAEVERLNARLGKKVAELAIALVERDEAVALLRETDVFRRYEEWHDDYGCCLWTRLPIDEPPYCGSPLDGDWPWPSDECAGLYWVRLPRSFRDDKAEKLLSKITPSKEESDA